MGWAGGRGRAVLGRFQGVGGMAEPLNPPHRSRCPGVLNQYAVTTGTKSLHLLPKGRAPHATDPPPPKDVGLKKDHVGTIFRSWARFGCCLGYPPLKQGRVVQRVCPKLVLAIVRVCFFAFLFVSIHFYTFFHGFVCFCRL